MTTATNPKTGEKVELVNGQWQPIQKTATNPNTGEKLQLVGNEWKPLQQNKELTLDKLRATKFNQFADPFSASAGLAARNLAEGAMSIPALVIDPMLAATNKLLGRQDMGMVPWLSSLLDKSGLPRPTSSSDRIISGIERAIGGAATGIGLAGLAGGVTAPAMIPKNPLTPMTAANPLTAQTTIPQTLASNPAVQLQSATGGALAGGMAQELGAGPKTQIAASLLGGLATPYAISGGQNAYNTIKNYFRPTAEQQLTNTAQAVGTPASQINKDVANLDQNATLADVQPAFKGLAQGTAARTPQTMQVVTKALEGRTKDLSNRMMETMQKAVGKQGNLYEDMVAQINERAKIAKPLYDQAYQQPISVTIKGNQAAIKTLNRLIKTPAIQAAIPNAEKIALNNGRQFDKTALQNAGVQAWDDIKQGLDDVIEANRDQFGRLNKVGNSVRNVKQQLLTVLDNNKAYKLARETYAGQSDMMDAMKFGSDLIGSKIPPGQVRRELARMTEGEKDAAINGLAGAIKDKIGSVKEDTAAAMNFIRTPNNKEKIAAMLGQEGYNKLRKFVETEVTYRKSQADIIGGSQTQIRQAAAKSVNQSVSMQPTDVTKSGITGEILRAISKVTGLSDKEALNLTKLVSTPEGRDKAISILSRAGLQKEEINQIYPTLVGLTTGEQGRAQ